MPTVFETVEQVDEQLALYREALKMISKGQQYTMPDGESLTTADLPEIRKTLRWLAHEKEDLQNVPGPRTLRGRPKR